MSDFYSNLKTETVVPLLTLYGTALTMKRFDTNDTWLKKFDPITSRVYWEKISDATISYTDPTGTPTEYTTVGVLTAYKQDEINGTTIKQGDMLLLTVNIPDPVIGDVFEIGTNKWGYVNSEKVSPDGATDVLYKVQVRK